MRIPLDWLTEYVNLKGLTPKEIGDAFTQIGLMTDKPFDGKVFNLEHRFDRSDWLSIIGCARDLAAYLGKDLRLPQVLKETGEKPGEGKDIRIEVECPDVVNRFNTRVFRNIKVKPSPEWMKRRLEEYGIPSINNIVDITNYVMVELGQPMHAQDLAKLRKPEIVLRHARVGETLVTFLGEEVKLVPEAFVLTQDGIPTVLGGIVGGRETGVDQGTRDIVLDAGNYDQNVIRKVSRKLKIQNETVSRYDKFLSPELTQYAIERAAWLISELAGGEYYQNADWNPNPVKTREMDIRRSRLLKIGGFDIGDREVTQILNRLGYGIVGETDSGWRVIVPYFRTDIEVEDDIVSDILRIHGYTKIPTAEIQAAPPKDITSDIYRFEETMRDLMVQLGAHEHITDPLVSRNENPAGNQIMLENSQNSFKDALRTNISSTLKQVVPNYAKNRIDSGIIFEIGKIYQRKDTELNYISYTEERVLECLVFGVSQSPKEVTVTTGKILQGLLFNLGVQNSTITKESDQEAQIMINGRTLGTLRYNGFSIFTEQLLKIQVKPIRILTEMITENSLEISFVIDKTAPAGLVVSEVSKDEYVQNVKFIEEYTGTEIGENKKAILIKIQLNDGASQENAHSVGERVIKRLKDSVEISIRR